MSVVLIQIGAMIGLLLILSAAGGFFVLLRKVNPALPGQAAVLLVLVYVAVMAVGTALGWFADGPRYDPEIGAPDCAGPPYSTC